MAARRAARAAARSPCDLDRPGRPDRSRADPAGEDVTELDSIPAGRIDQEGPYCITDFRAVPFPQQRVDDHAVHPATPSGRVWLDNVHESSRLRARPVPA